MRSNGNVLCYGDNLEVLRRHVKDESVDLVYLDPPFQSGRDYNVLFEEQDGSRSAAQIKAFEDTWRWDEAAEQAYEALLTGGGHVAEVLRAFRVLFQKPNDMLAYLVMMAPRLMELHRVLKPTGSLYLHCDPTASHYLKMLLDAILGPVQFRNEIIWKRSQPKAHATVRFSRAHDVILFYAKSPESVFHVQHRAHDPEYLEKFYRHEEEGTGRRYRLGDLTNPNKNRPNLTYEFPPGSGVVRVWRWTKDRMMKAWKEGLVIVPDGGGVAQAKRYLDSMEGSVVTDLWDDIEHLHGTQQEHLGYQTQKPEALLERIIQAGSQEGEVVLDPFCGCGTAVAVAQRLKRRWIGIDITHLAIGLIKYRLVKAFGERMLKDGEVRPGVEYRTLGEPTDLSGAAVLAEKDPYQFQCWALGLVGARPTGEIKKGADRGVDGHLDFEESWKSGDWRKIIFSVKGGKIPANHLRELRGVLAREDAAIVGLLTLEPPTRPMRLEAVQAGFYESPWGKHPRLQMYTIEELLAGKRVNAPPLPDRAVKAAPRVVEARGKQGALI